MMATFGNFTRTPCGRTWVGLGSETMLNYGLFVTEKFGDSFDVHRSRGSTFNCWT